MGVLDNPGRPLTAILGGAKVSDKDQLIKNLLDKVNVMIIGGGMAFTFLKVVQGVSIGSSLFDDEGAKIVQEIMDSAKAKGVEIVLPVDFVVSSKFGEDGEIKSAKASEGIPDGFMGLDCGPDSIARNAAAIAKSKLGANAILAVSMAVCRAGAAANEMPLYQYIAKLGGKPMDKFVMPVPSFNVINGGSHAGNRLACQEFMILPVGATSFKEAMIMGTEVYHTLKGCIKKKYGQDACNVGDEGGFAPSVQDNDEALDVLMEALKKSGHEGKVKIGTDVAASEFWKADIGKYDLDFKNPNSDDSMKKTAAEMVDYYKSWLTKHPFVSIEDPFDQDDWDAYKMFMDAVGKDQQIVGDDLLVTNPMRIKKALEVGACNALLMKVNQIGSITEAIEAATMSHQAGWGVMVSHRSGETDDAFIADLVVGLRTGQIKTGAPCRSERLAKYNQLIRIEEELGPLCTYAGVNFRAP